MKLKINSTNKNTIKHIDDFFSPEEHNKIIKYTKSALYSFGEQDRADTEPVGMIAEITDPEIYDLFINKIKKSIQAVADLNPHRMYINCFAPNENPYFHIDGKKGITCLYYVNETYNLDDGGETQFLINKNESINILPIPNRMCYFNANITHKATSFRNTYRFTIAVKYS